MTWLLVWSARSDKGTNTILRACPACWRDPTRSKQLSTVAINSWLSVWTLSCRCPVKLFTLYQPCIIVYKSWTGEMERRLLHTFQPTFLFVRLYRCCRKFLQTSPRYTDVKPELLFQQSGQFPRGQSKKAWASVPEEEGWGELGLGIHRPIGLRSWTFKVRITLSHYLTDSVHVVCFVDTYPQDSILCSG